MNLPLTLTWTAGLALSVGSLCLAEPAPWLQLGLTLTIGACAMLARELGRIARRSRRHMTLADLGLDARSVMERAGRG